MANYTIYPTHDGRVYSHNYTYLTARSGSGLSYDATYPTVYIGQYSGADYECYEYFQTFNIAALSLSGVYASSAYFSIYCLNNRVTSPSQDHTVNVRAVTYSDTAFGTAAWIAGASVGSNTLVATFQTVDLIDVTRHSFNSQAALANGINFAGKNQYVFVSSRFEAGTTADRDDWDLRTADYTGTTYDPYLYMETAPTSVKTGSYTANAYIRATVAGTPFTADAAITRGFFANAHIRTNGVLRALTADAFIGESAKKTATFDTSTGSVTVKVFRTPPDTIRLVKVYRKIRL